MTKKDDMKRTRNTEVFHRKGEIQKIILVNENRNVRRRKNISRRSIHMLFFI